MLFIQYLLSVEGQTLLMAKKGSPGGPITQELAKMSVIPTLYEVLKDQNSIPINPFEWQTSFAYNFELASKRWGVINDLIGIFLIEGNSYLRSIREKYIDRGNTPLLIPEFTPPITEARVSELVDQKILLDPRLRNEELLRWRKLIPYDGKQSGFSVTQVPLWILCLVLSISVVLRFFAKNSG